MALLAEEIVEEWLNRQGYFTIRGIKMGVHEIDLLAIKPGQDSTVECRHIEVQASMRPISYITKVPKKARTQDRSANSPSRTRDELVQGVAEWVDKKYLRADKRVLMARLWPGDWSSELVVNAVRFEEELEVIASHGVRILRLHDIIESLATEHFPVPSASGADLVDLIQMGFQSKDVA